jgi:hypothetical protein
LRLFLAQGAGRLSERARLREFQALSDAEVERLQALYAQAFGILRDERLPAHDSSHAP